MVLLIRSFFALPGSCLLCVGAVHPLLVSHRVGNNFVHASSLTCKPLCDACARNSGCRHIINTAVLSLDDVHASLTFAHTSFIGNINEDVGCSSELEDYYPH